MISSDFRTEARRKLSGKWGKVSLITLAYLSVFFLIGFVEGFVLGILGIDSDSSLIQLINLVIEIPLSFGLITSLFKVYNSEDVVAFSFWSYGFQNFKKALGISIRMVLKLIVPVILLIVSIMLVSFGLVSALVYSSELSLLSLLGILLYFASIIWFIVKSYYYQLSYIIAIDEPNLTAKEVVDKSKELMTGNCGKLFGLQFSFIGWAILASFTFGIGLLWLLPYIQFATFAFYYFVANKEVTPEVINENK